jgi:ABC-type amino acid transport substrate-binding protein
MTRTCLVAIAVALCSATAVQADDLPALKQRGVLRVIAVRQDSNPEFFSMAAGEPGFDREILDAFAKTQGLRTEYVPVATWDQLVPALVAGRGDMIAGRVSNTEARARVLDFTDEVFPTRNVVFNFAPRPPVTTHEQLMALPRIASARGSSMAESLAAEGVPAAKIAYPEPAALMPDFVEKGDPPAGAWVVEAAIVWQRAHPGLQIGMFLGPPQSLAYGVPKQTPLLLAALNAHIRLVKQSGTWNRLVVKYFGQQAPDVLKRARETQPSR